MNEPDAIRRMLDSHTIAVIGLSDDPAKPSHYVSRYMQVAGKRILPINPPLSATRKLPHHGSRAAFG